MTEECGGVCGGEAGGTEYARFDDVDVFGRTAVHYCYSGRTVFSVCFTSWMNCREIYPE